MGMHFGVIDQNVLPFPILVDLCSVAKAPTNRLDDMLPSGDRRARLIPS